MYIYIYMSQSWVEIEHYSIVYFDSTTMFEVELPLRVGLISTL